MAIAKNIVQKMDGDIKVKSVLGQGSEFTVTIHLKYCEKSYKKFEKMSVLIVDDMEVSVLKISVFPLILSFNFLTVSL